MTTRIKHSIAPIKACCRECQELIHVERCKRCGRKCECYQEVVSTSEFLKNHNSRIKQMLRKTWNAVGHDMTHNGQDPNIRVIAETALYANYLESHGPGSSKKPLKQISIDRDIIRLFRALPYKDQYKIAREMYRP